MTVLEHRRIADLLPKRESRHVNWTSGFDHDAEGRA
jgi:hypothetical protein